MNLCWFCANPGIRNLDQPTAKKIILGSVCEAHLDYQFFYYGTVVSLGEVLTPRMVMNQAEKIARETLMRNN